jgi:preprotein translocase subunit SecB
MLNTKGSKQPEQVMVTCVGQYIRKLSFDSLKNKLELGKIEIQKPTVSYSIATKQEKIGDTEHEVILLIEVVSKIGEKSEEVFKLQLEYAGIFKIEGEIKESDKEEILLIDCITLLFPFARREVAAITLGGGYQPLMLEPIDFRSSYLQYKQMTANENEEPMTTNEAVHSRH